MHFIGIDVEPRFGRYYNGNTAIELIDIEDGSPVATATVNGDLSPLPDYIVGIKDWGENVGMTECLIDGNLITPEVVMTEPSGYVTINYHRLTENGMELLMKAKHGL